MVAVQPTAFHSWTANGLKQLCRFQCISRRKPGPNDRVSKNVHSERTLPRNAPGMPIGLVEGIRAGLHQADKILSRQRTNPACQFQLKERRKDLSRRELRLHQLQNLVHLQRLILA
jgi:hypothetical protein